MHGSRSSAREWVRDVTAELSDLDAVDAAVFPPATLIATAADAAGNSSLAVGGQDVSEHESGAHTGDVSVAMLSEAGASMVIVGHSERRADHGESDDLVASKAAQALAGGLQPVICVGETLAEREAGQTEAVVARQLDAVVAALGADGLAASVLAYEPVWAIGTGKTATPDQAQAVHDFLRRRLATVDDRMASEMRILYGGSVKGANARELFDMADIDGGLIGGASLAAEDFLPICRAAQDLRSRQ